MAKDVNLTSKEWCDIVFEGQNKAYGAYRLRRSSGKRHTFAFVVIAIIAVVAFSVPKLFEVLGVGAAKEEMTEVTALSNIKMDEPEVPEENKIRDLVAPPPPELKSTIKFTPPVVKKDELVNEENEMKSQEDLTKSDVQISIADVKGTNEETGVDIATLEEHKVIVAEEPKEEKVFDFVEQPPTFPGGEEQLRAFLKNNIHYPVVAQENNISGRVTCSFVVGKDGSIQDVIVVRGQDKSLDKEAVRLIKSMPKWIPGRQGGRAVKVKYFLPITFRLD